MADGTRSTSGIAPAPIRVLLVDDDGRFRSLARELLEGDGYDVVAEAGCAAEAVRLARLLRPDVVVSDVVMPEADEALLDLASDADDIVLDLSTEESGLRVAAALRSGDDPPCVVLVSSLFDPAVERRARRLGATFVEKVAGVDALEQAIDAGVRQRAGLG